MIQFLKKMKRLISLIPLGVALLLALLLFRNPFGQRTLIPNMEPYPDVFHYVVPARSLANGGDFAITRGFGDLSPNVPPLYSVLLIPFYMVNSDARMFYFLNVILDFVSFGLFYLVLKKTASNIWIITSLLFLFATNFFVYWYPQFAMAENLILPLFLLAVLMLIEKPSKTRAIVSGILVVGFYATKYAAIPLSAIFFVLYLLKTKDKHVVSYISALGVAALVLLFYLEKVLHMGTLGILSNYLVSIFSESSAIAGISGTTWFSSTYIPAHLAGYLGALLGNSGRFMWDFTPMLPKWLAILGILGLLFGVLKKKFRFLCLSIILMILGQTLFISSFYSVDNRYIYMAIPAILIGVSFILSFAGKKALYAALFIIIGFYVFSNAQRLKYQISLNLRHAETPWSYISVLKLNNFMEHKDFEDKRVYVISPLPPYYIDFYSDGKYGLLPLSDAQEFREKRQLVWGPGDYSDLHRLYREYLVEGNLLFVSTYGLGNEAYLHKAFDDLAQDFSLTEVQSECYTQCKIYSLKLKNVKGL